MVEQGTENPRVGSSILSLGTRESKGLQRKLLAFFRYGLLPDARLRQPPGGAFHRAGLPALPPSFPAFSFVLSLSRSRDCPRRYRWLPDAHTGLHPYGLRPGAARRVPHIRIIMPRSLAPLPRVLCHGLLAREKAGRKPLLLPAPCGRSLGHGPARSRESGKGHAFPA